MFPTGGAEVGVYGESDGIALSRTIVVLIRSSVIFGDEVSGLSLLDDLVVVTGRGSGIYYSMSFWFCAKIFSIISDCRCIAATRLSVFAAC